MTVVQLRKDFDGPPPPPPEPPEPPADEGPAGGPITVLGQRSGTFYFFDYMGQFRELTAHQIGIKQHINALFGDRGIQWLVDQFPAFDKHGDPTGSYSVDGANRWIIREAGSMVFDGSMPSRGLGLWRAGEAVVAHLGDRICWDGEWRHPGFQAEGALWPARPPLFEVQPPAPPGDLAELEAMMRRWNWAHDGSAEVMFGLWCAGVLGASIPWRPHAFIVGEAYSGKSTLFGLLAAANPTALLVNSYTEAGIRQSLSQRASAALMDEADADEQAEAEKLQRVIGFLRLTSGGQGAQVLRGSPDGSAQRFDVVCSAIMGGILPPNFKPQDASRITRLDLRRKAADSKGLPSEVQIRDLRSRAPAFLSRALLVAPRFMEVFRVYHAALIELDGNAPRMADQLGTILAARHIMLSDRPPEAVGDDLDLVRWAIPSAEDRESEGGPRQCLHHLLHAQLDQQKGGERPVVWRTVLDAIAADAGIRDEAKRSLLNHGMRVGPYPLKDQAGAPVLYVMNQHQQLARMFAGTRWAGEKWREDLARLPGAVVPPNPIKLSTGNKIRVVVIPRALLPYPGDGGDGDQD
ncbi:hypothetical protein [Rhodovarius crocodyli]|uniref:hypothetical protein n=1 Tax=Rhodovarius crocodyli TaxID=1979269 RepID=UPI0013E3C82D|nr:hypothetical protein [Rhodovarius crocodyli]